MRLHGIKIAALAAIAAGLAGCASDENFSGRLPPGPAASPGFETPAERVECVPYARQHSSVKIHGDAWTWWDKAAGKYSREAAPEAGAVMVLAGYAGPERGHVAVVRTVISSREIRIDHANWLGHGAIYLDDPVADVSPDNDWSQVRVWNIKTGAWGVHVYPVQGFIGPAAESARVASLEPEMSDINQ